VQPTLTTYTAPEFDENDLPALNRRWDRVYGMLKQYIGKPKINMEGILLLIGIREMGLMPRKFEKDEKKDLMHVGLCTILTPAGYYRLTHWDEDRWPHFELLRPLPGLDIFAQVHFMRHYVAAYFEHVWADELAQAI